MSNENKKPKIDLTDFKERYGQGMTMGASSVTGGLIIVGLLKLGQFLFGKVKKDKTEIDV